MRIKLHSCLFLSLALSVGAYCEGVLADASIPSVDVYCPAAGSALPVVFFAHNGGAKKEDWSDYPRSLAEQGYLAASIGWTSNAGIGDLLESMEEVMKKYADRIDPARVAFVGGCHGGVKMVMLMKSPSAAIRPKTAVFLSISEMAVLPEGHVPVLGIYSTDDRLGSYYKSFTKKYVETLLVEPKKVFAYEGSPHGNELVADRASKEAVRGEIDAWLKDKL
jgi:hypothetical protein